MSVVFKAEARENLGTSASKKIKRAGRIPAVIYAQNGNINFSLDVKEFEHEYFKGNSLTSLVEIELGGKKIKAIAHKVELDPVSDRPVHVDFLNCDETKSLRAQPKINFINQERSPGLKRGGFLHIVLRKIEVVCDNIKEIPEKIDIDTSVMQVGHKVRSGDLNLGAGVKLVGKANILIASIIGRGKGEEDPAAAAAGATPAAGAAAPAAGAAKPAAKAEEKKPAAKK